MQPLNTMIQSSPIPIFPFGDSPQVYGFRKYVILLNEGNGETFFFTWKDNSDIVQILHSSNVPLPHIVTIDWFNCYGVAKQSSFYTGAMSELPKEDARRVFLALIDNHGWKEWQRA